MHGFAWLEMHAWLHLLLNIFNGSRTFLNISTHFPKILGKIPAVGKSTYFCNWRLFLPVRDDHSRTRAGRMVVPFGETRERTSIEVPNIKKSIKPRFKFTFLLTSFWRRSVRVGSGSVDLIKQMVLKNILICYSTALISDNVGELRGIPIIRSAL